MVISPDHPFYSFSSALHTAPLRPHILFKTSGIESDSPMEESFMRKIDANIDVKGEIDSHHTKLSLIG